jgi:hypothetical protein
VNYKYIGLVILAIWLTAQGLEGLFEFYFPHEDKILPTINLIAGVLLLSYAIKLKHGDLGLFFLGCWAVLNSGLFLFHYSFSYSNTIVNVLGVVAGVMLIIKM